MRVDSIISINAKPQQHPRTRQYESSSPSKNASGISFSEYLKTNLQQTSNQPANHQTENQLAGLLMGYFSNLTVISKTEQKLKENAG